MVAADTESDGRGSSQASPHKSVRIRIWGLLSKRKDGKDFPSYLTASVPALRAKVATTGPGAPKAGQNEQ